MALLDVLCKERANNEDHHPPYYANAVKTLGFYCNHDLNNYI